MKNRYVLNSSVITSPGKYVYKWITVEEAINWLSEGEYKSNIGYKETADALYILTNRKFVFDVNRETIKMDVGDEALIFRLTSRLMDPELKGKLSLDFVINNSEIGILRKVDQILDIETKT